MNNISIELSLALACKQIERTVFMITSKLLIFATREVSFQSLMLKACHCGWSCHVLIITVLFHHYLIHNKALDFPLLHTRMCQPD